MVIRLAQTSSTTFWHISETYLREFIEKEGNINTANKFEFAKRIEFCQKAFNALR